MDSRPNWQKPYYMDKPQLRGFWINEDGDEHFVGMEVFMGHSTICPDDDSPMKNYTHLEPPALGLIVAKRRDGVIDVWAHTGVPTKPFYKTSAIVGLVEEEEIRLFTDQVWNIFNPELNTAAKQE